MSVVVRQLINPQHDLKIPTPVGPGSVFLLPTLLTMWREVLGWTGVFVESGNLAMVGFVKSTTVGKMFFSMPFGGYGGLLGTATNCPPQDLLSWLKSNRFLQENIVQFDPQGPVEFPHDYYRNKLTTHIVDLSQASEEYSENTKRNLKKAQGYGLKVARVDLTQKNAFIALLTAHQKRTGEVRRLPQGCYEYLLSISQQRDRGISIWAASNADGIQCVHIYFVSSSDAFYFDGFSSQVGLDAGANFLLLDNMIADFRSSGIARLNLGATPPLDKGLRRFKEGWGARSFDYIEYSRRSQLKRMIDFMTRVR